MSSLSFNGTSDFARATPAVTAYPLTFASWFYVTDISVIRAVTSLNTSGSNNNRLGMSVVATTGVFRMAASDTANTSTDTTNTVTLNAWQFGAAVYTNATTRKVILNGDTANAGTSSTARTPVGINRFSIGVNDASTQAQFFQGQIWATGLWSVALTDEEVVALSKGWPMRKMRPQSLAQFIPYPGLSGRDIIGGNSFSITGATASANAPSVPHPI